MRRLFVILVSAAGVVLACVFMLALTIYTGEPRPFTTAASAWLLTQAVGTETRVGRSSGSIWRGIELHEIEVGSDDEARLSIDRARLVIEPLALMDGRLEIRSLLLAGLTIEGTRQDDGRWRWAGGIVDLGEGGPESEAPDEEPTGDEPGQGVVLHALLLQDVRFRLQWTSARGPARLSARLDAELREIDWPPVGPDRWLPPFEAQLSQLELAGDRFEIERGALTARHDDGDLELSTEGIHGPWGAIARAEIRTRIEGTLDAPRVERGHAEAEFVGIDPGRLLEGEWPASDVSGTTRFDWQNADARGELELEPFTLFGVPVDAAEARGRLWREDELLGFELESLRLSSPVGELAGRVAGDSSRARELLVEQARVDLAALPDALLPDDLEAGRIDLTARLSGPWNALGGDFELRVDGLRHRDLGTLSGSAAGTLHEPWRARLRSLRIDASDGPIPTFASRQPFDAALERGALHLRGVRLAVADGELGLDGAVSGDRFGRLHVRAQALELARLLPDGEAGASGDAFDGRLSSDLVVDGPLGAPVVDGVLDWNLPRIGEFTAERAHFVLKPAATGPAQQLHLELVVGKELALEVDASFSTTDLLRNPLALIDDRTLRLDMRADDLDAGLFARTGVPEDQLPSGRIDARVKAFGPLREPLLEGRVDWRDASWRALSADRIVAVIESNADAGNARFDLSVVQGGRDSLRGVFEVADRRLFLRPRELLTNPDAKLEIVFDAFDLATLDPLTESSGVFVRGVANGRVRVVAGPVPEATGEVTIARLAAAGPSLPFEVGPTPARFSFAGQVARVSQIELPSTDGAAQIRGQVAWSDPGNPQLQLRLRTDAFAIELPGIVTGRLDGDAFVFGTPSALTGEGGLLLHHARIDLPDAEDPIFREIRVQSAAIGESGTLAADESSTLYDALEGQLSMKLGESVWLRGIGAELELRGELIARKERDEPAGLYGSVEVASGRIDFQGKWLRVTSGSAIFDGNADPDPYIDATAVHRVSDVTIRARLFGRASALSLELDSDPPMSPEDQISYLLFDRAATDIGTLDQQNVGAMAAMLAGDLLLGRVGTEIAQEVGIDRVRVGVDQNDSPTLEVEKQIYERVTLRYGRGFGAEGGDRFVVEWRLFRDLFLSGEQLTNGESGVDIFWRLDY